MKAIIIKFGGSSLADPGKIRRAAALALASKRRGFAPVVVVSAPADSTDDLLGLAALTGGKDLNPRETDALLAAGEQFSAALLALAIEAEGGKAVSLTGFQAGIRTDAEFSAAAVKSVDARRVKKELKAGRIPVVAGFQGASPRGDITTLGRGGSDLTAVTLARALGSAPCEFRTDVKGIYTAHPAIVPEASKIKNISYGEVIALAEAGTEVRQLRAVRYAGKYSIPLHLRSSFHDEAGTLVTAAGGKPGVSCLSIKKDGGAALVSAIGRGLGAKHAGAALSAAAAAGVSASRQDASGGKLVLRTSPLEAETLLKALHSEFFPRHWPSDEHSS
ncbi:MAG: aspartate kinase [Elusimicrobia bacterium]|nr:aspartate kinase [Elusimicrobiota bacterium]